MSASDRHDGDTLAPSQATAELPVHRTPAGIARDIVLFFAAPFITLAYLPVFAVIGAMMLFRKDSAAWREWHATE